MAVAEAAELEIETLQSLGLPAADGSSAGTTQSDNMQLARLLSKWAVDPLGTMEVKPATTLSTATQESRHRCLATWVSRLRMDALRQLSASAPPFTSPLPIEPASTVTPVLRMLDPSGGMFGTSTNSGNRLLFAIQSGSAMHNLATPASDEDYVLVYAASPFSLLALDFADF